MGCYPAHVSENEFPLIDLVICHGDFLNAHHDYIHENTNFRGFGSYGDIKIRDRKMYIAPTPFALTRGTAGQRTLIVPESYELAPPFTRVGLLVRTETDRLIVGYSFDMETNVLTPRFSPNPAAGSQHAFAAYRLNADGPVVFLASIGAADETELT